jgi:hypothetical protein
LQSWMGKKANSPGQRQTPDRADGARHNRRSPEPQTRRDDDCRMAPLGVGIVPCALRGIDRRRV